MEVDIETRKVAVEPCKGFCEECRKDVEYTVLTKAMTASVMGLPRKYIGKEARCSDCGNLLYIPWINDYNLEMLYK